MLYTIPLENLDTFENRFNKLVKAANKIGVPAPTRLILGHIQREVKNTDGVVERTYTVVEVSVEGSAPVIAGWQFVAVLEHTDEGNIVRRVPGSDESIDLAAYRTVEPWCDHCRLNRRRNDTYLVRRNKMDAHDIKQVGSSCLKDFTGHADPHAYARLAEMLIDFDLYAGNDEDDYLGGGSGSAVSGLRWVLSRTVCAIRERGWAPRSKSLPGHATADVVMDENFKGISRDGDEALIEAAIDWARTMDAGDNDYLWNLRTVCKHDYIGDRQIGIAASLITAYQREEAKKYAAETSGHVGTVGKRCRFRVRLTQIAWREGFGPYDPAAPTYYFVDEESGWTLIWYATREQQDWVEGMTLPIEGFVKDQRSLRDGTKVTIINRVKEIA